MSKVRLPLALLCSASLAAVVAAQPDTGPAFAVVSIKKNTSGITDVSRMRLQPGGRLVVENRPLRALILFAYALQPQQLAGGPAWLDSDRFDIVAQTERDIPPSPPGGPPGLAQVMFQQLLAERFKLAVHREMRDTPVFALTLARDDGQLGPKIRRAERDCAALMAAMVSGRTGSATPPASPRLPDGRPACGTTGRPGQVLAGGMSPQGLAAMLSGLAGRIVVDRTGLGGGFDFELEFAPDAPGGGPALTPGPGSSSTDPDRPSLFIALQEQLGLKLQPERAPVDVIVIDHVEPPTEN